MQVGQRQKKNPVKEEWEMWKRVRNVNRLRLFLTQIGWDYWTGKNEKEKTENYF